MARWLTAGATGPVTIAAMAPTVAGVTDRITITVKDAEFAPVGDAEVTVRVTNPDNETRQLTPALSSPQEGRYAVAARFDQPGVYRLDAVAVRGADRLGTATRQVLVGGTDVEMSQPRLNEAVLQRLAQATGGRYMTADQAQSLPGLVRQARSDAGPPDLRDLWHNGWSLVAIVGLMAVEWVLRRRVGLA